MTSESGSPRIARRGLLAGIAGLIAAGCAGRGADRAGGSGPARRGPGVDTVAGTRESGVPAAAPSTTGPRPSVAPDRAALIAKYGAVRPTSWGTDVAGVAQRVQDQAPPTVALTFDACGGPHADGIDQALLDLLRREQLPATLFLNARWVQANSVLARDLAEDPQFEIGNHGTRHVPLSVTGASAYGIAGTTSVEQVIDEVWENHVLLTELTGRAPRWFRSGTAHYDEVATAIVADLGERPVGFVVNGDAGATFSPSQVRTELTSPAVGTGSIVIMHMIRPSGGTAEGLTAALPALRARGSRFVTLTEGGGVAS